MHIKVRMLSTGKSESFEVSRTETVDNLRCHIENKFKIKPEKQRLLYSGKQLENGHTLYDYSINYNDVIQLMVRESIPIIQSKNELKSSTKNKLQEEHVGSSTSTSSSHLKSTDYVSEKSKYFKIGDYVDIKDDESGSWFIAKLINIKKHTSTDIQNDTLDDGLTYVVEFFQASTDPTAEVKLQDIRPHTSTKVPVNTLKPGDKVLMNYNTEYPREKGYWYDVVVKQVKHTRKGFEVVGDIILGSKDAVLADKNLKFVDDIYLIKSYVPLVNRTPEEDKLMKMEPIMRFGPLYCLKCKDNLSKQCKECGCNICGGKDNEDTQLMCDECDHPFHMACLNPPVTVIPDDEWYCPSCKNDENEVVKAGEKLKLSKKKNNPQSVSTSKRDWGRGMACVGRSKTCTIVPFFHFGTIPGVEVGTTWLFRIQASEAGVHRPVIGGIHGRSKEGAPSIVLSGGYDDDKDYGDSFWYTGSGGRDLSNNKRTGKQTHGQKLERYNRALALDCDATLNLINGAKAKNWKNGKPIRVIRSHKQKKISDYAPDIGYRYDGIYKLVRYEPKKGKSGFMVWKYFLKRDDETPAPWTPEGKENINRLGLNTVICPENYNIEEVLAIKKSKSGKRKRTLQDKDNNDLQTCPNKKQTIFRYKLESDLEKLIAADVDNKKYWDDCKSSLDKGKQEFLKTVQITFVCICCQEVVSDPITTKCTHNMCKNCLVRSFTAKVFQCPVCRGNLDKNCYTRINNNLAKTLLFLFPGYNSGR